MSEEVSGEIEEVLEKIKELDSKMKEQTDALIEKIDSIHGHVEEIRQTLGITEKKRESTQGSLGQSETIIQQIYKINSSIQ